MEERQAKNKMARLVEWMGENMEIQAMLCDGGFEADAEDCIALMDMLEEQGFYELIYVLLIKNQQDDVIWGTMEKLLADAWARRWEQAGTRAMLREIRERIRSEMGINDSACGEI